MSDIVFKAVDLVVNYGGVHAVDHVSFSIGSGQLCGLIGPNGSGKSSLLAAISRTGKISSGELYFQEANYSSKSRHVAARLGIARTFQTVRLQEGMTVLENVMLGADKRFADQTTLLRWLQLDRKAELESRDVSYAMLDKVGLRNVSHLYPNMLSYGTQRKVEIARCLAGKPSLLLLDEPTAGMSRAETDEISELLMQLRSNGMTQLLVAHDLQMIHDVTDHVFALNFGRLIAEGPSLAVSNDPSVREAYIGFDEDEGALESQL